MRRIAFFTNGMHFRESPDFKMSASIQSIFILSEGTLAIQKLGTCSSRHMGPSLWVELKSFVKI